MPQTCLLVDAALPRTGSPTDRACAIVGYRRARNAAARRAHAQRRRRYCEGLFRHYEVSLHYYAHESDPVERFFRELHRTIEGTWLADPARVRSQFGWGWSRDVLETLSVNTKVIQS